MTDLAGEVTWEWLCSNLTIYADDFHAQDTFTCIADFERHIRCVNAVLRLLRSWDLPVSPDKSQVLLVMRGPDTRKM